MKKHSQYLAVIYVVAIAFIFMGVSARSIRAQSAPELKTLDDYIAAAREANPAIKAAYERWQAKAHRTGYAGALPDPVFSIGHFVDPIETRVGPQENRFSIRQTVPWFGTLGAKKHIAAFAAESEKHKYEASSLRVIFDIKNAYFDFYLLGREIELTEENIALLKYWESVIETRYKTGRASHSDLIRTQIERSLLEQNRDELKDRVEPLRRHIGAILNLDSTEALTIPRQLDSTDFPLTLEQAAAIAIEENPDINAALAVIEKSQAKSRLAGKSSMPNVTLGVDYFQTGPALDPTMPESGKDAWNINVGITLPVWFGANSAKKQEARAAVRAARQTHIETKNRVRAEVSRVYARLETARRNVNLYRENIIPQTERLVDVVFAGYESGANDILELLSAQRRLLDTRLGYERARVDLAVSAAALETIVGNFASRTE